MSDTNVNIAASVNPVSVQAERAQRKNLADAKNVSPKAETEPVKLAVPKDVVEVEETAQPRKELERAVESMATAAGLIDHGYNIQVDETTDRVVAQIVDRQSREVIRQFPEEEVLNISRRLREYIGVLFDVDA